MAKLTGPQIERLMTDHPGIIWSNPNPPASAIVRHFLLSARFAPIRDLAKAIGVDALTREWECVRDSTPLNKRAIVYITLIIEVLNETSRPVANRS